MKLLLFLFLFSSCNAFTPIHHKRSLYSIGSKNVRKEMTTTRTAISTTESSSSTSPKNRDGISIPTGDDYPENFSGRLWFNPALVKVPTTSENGPGSDVTVLSLFGYSLGGTVTLEYDTSPVGPYREHVTMSALVMKKGAIGQWGSRLYVSTQEAEDVCKDIWGVPAELANIEYVEERENEGDSIKRSLYVTCPPNPNSKASDAKDISIRVEGWKNTRVLNREDYEYGDGNPKRWGSVPVFWTPTIKALWAPFIPFGGKEGNKENDLPLRKLRLSASAMRLHWSGLEKDIKVANYSEEDYNVGIPLGVSLIVDNVLIEIGTRMETNFQDALETMKYAQSISQRGDIVLFRSFRSTDEHNLNSNDLLVGIVQEVSAHYKVNVQHVSCAYVLTCHVIGECCPKQQYLDHVKIQNSNNVGGLSMALRHFRREVASNRIRETGTDGDVDVDASQIICSQVRCLDDIIIRSRSYITKKSPFARKQMDIWESCIVRPSTYHKNFKEMLDILERRNNEMLLYIKMIHLRSWAKKAKLLSKLRLEFASMQIQRHFRGYSTRKSLSCTPDRFKGYYVPEHLTGTVRCYKIKPGVYLSTQAKANEYFSLLSKSLGVMARFSVINSRSRMLVSLSRWKNIINRQKIEQQQMYEEEMFSIF